MPAPKKIHDLVTQFQRNRDDYRTAIYNETQARREFIDPFFKALGWDVDNEQGYAEAYKDVVHETAVKVQGKTKAPDYAFRIGGQPKFFVEAKKPSVNIKDDLHPAFQLRSYAWSGKLPLSILTDFEEFVVYDCRPRPVKSDKAAQRTGVLFERPFGRKIVDSQPYLLTLIAYIHHNPQRHGFVTDFREWSWSSCGTMLSEQPTRLNRDEVLAWYNGRSSFIEAHATELDEQLIAPLLLEDWW